MHYQWTDSAMLPLFLPMLWCATDSQRCCRSYRGNLMMWMSQRNHLEWVDASLPSRRLLQWKTVNTMLAACFLNMIMVFINYCYWIPSANVALSCFITCEPNWAACGRDKLLFLLFCTFRNFHTIQFQTLKDWWCWSYGGDRQYL